jgi:hypothetical protein
MKTNIHFWSYLAPFFLERKMFQTKIVQKIKTHILCSVTFFFFRKLCRLWDNVEKYCTAGHATWQYGACALRAGYQRLQVHTLRLYNTHCFSPTTMVARKRLNVTLYVYCMSCFSMDSLVTFTPHFLEILYGRIKLPRIVLVTRFKCIDSATLTCNQNTHLEKNIHTF